MQTNNKLREAVVLALSLLDLKEGVPYKTISQKDIDFIKAALAEPVKNYEVGTAEEQLKRHGEWCTKRPATTHPCLDWGWCRKCFVEWEQMPYIEKEGGAK